MARRRRPQSLPKKPAATGTPNIHVLDRFTVKDLETWEARSGDLDELHQLLYFATEPFRISHRDELIRALNKKPMTPFSFDGVRIVAHRWSTLPLSCAGSLKNIGGRFNIGRDVDHAMTPAFPALYVGEDFETAYREYFQMTLVDGVNGLRPEELSLEGSITGVRLRGYVERVLDVSDPFAVGPVCRVLAKCRMPERVPLLLKRLRERPDAVRMVKTIAALQEALQTRNWRAWPVQFGLPSPSQQFAELALAAGYEAIRYRSSKAPNSHCLAFFPTNFGPNTFVELVDQPPEEVEFARLDQGTCDQLIG